MSLTLSFPLTMIKFLFAPWISIFVVTLFASVSCFGKTEVGAPAIVCSAYNFRKGSVFEAIEKAALCGIPYIETFTNQGLSPDDPTRIYALSEDQVKRLKAHLDQYGVKIASCMGAVSKDEVKARAFFDAVQRLGAKNVGTDSVDAIDTIEKIIGDYDLTVAFHNHPSSPQKPDYRNSDPYFMRSLLEGRHERIGVCSDTGHHATSNVIPLEAIRLLAGRIKSVHLKDRAAIGRKTPDQVLGTGVVGIEEILRELDRQRFLGWLIIEYETNPEDNLDDIRGCAAFIRSRVTTQSLVP